MHFYTSTGKNSAHDTVEGEGSGLVINDSGEGNGGPASTLNRIGELPQVVSSAVGFEIGSASGPSGSVQDCQSVPDGTDVDPDESRASGS